MFVGVINGFKGDEALISLMEVFYTLILFVWVLIVVQMISKGVYEVAAKKWEHYVGVYFARKTIHILAGGLVAFVIAWLNLFSTPILPFLLGVILAAFCYLPRRTGKLMEWFQDPNNMYEVNFCLIWSIIMGLGWLVAGGDFWLGTVPILFMAWGDGITGIVRNFVFKKRTKHWIGNVAMFLLCAPLAYFLGFGVGGVIAALIASMIEHIEKIGGKFVDDNITVPVSSFIVLSLFTLLNVPYVSP